MAFFIVFSSKVLNDLFRVINRVIDNNTAEKVFYAIILVQTIIIQIATIAKIGVIIYFIYEI
jgi:hypothetical protein